MIETEKAILAVSIEYPETQFFLFENCDDSFFKGLKNKEIFKIMKDLYEGKSVIDWMSIIDLSNVESSYFTSMLKTLMGVYGSGAKRFIREKIKLVKKIKAKRELLKEIEGQAKLENPDFDLIKEIINGAKIVDLETENTDFTSAYQEYLKWKTKDEIQIKLGFPTFDRWIGALNYGEIVSILARTSIGKSFCALKILQGFSDDIYEVTGFFSFEMPKAAVVERMLQIYFGLWREDVQKQIGFLDTVDFERKYKKIKLYNRIYSVNEIEKIITRDSLKVIFIDFLQLLKEAEGRSPYERTSANMRSLKEMAMNQEILIFLLVQLSRRAGGGWEPVTIDAARESGQIEELSDFIISIWNPYLNPSLNEKKKEIWRGKVCMNLLKNKRGPGVGITCFFDKKSGQIYEIEEDNERDRQDQLFD